MKPPSERGSDPATVRSFEIARSERLFGKTSEATRVEDLPALIQLWLRANQTSGAALLIIEKEEGGVVLICAQVTFAQAVYLLEAAKVNLFTPEPSP